MSKDKYWLDTSVILRFLLNDVKDQARKARRLLEKAEKGEMDLVLLDEVILEVEYVLRGVYDQPREEIAKVLRQILGWEFIQVEKRSVWLEAVGKYELSKVDLVDIYLFLRVKEGGGEVYSFDRDLEKLKEAD